MFYFGQEQWNWLVVTYLFLGGMGAMVMAIATLAHRLKLYGQDNTRLMVWGNLTGFAMLAIGSLMLFYHLLDHLAVWHVLLGIFRKPDAWIAWGTWSIILGMIWGVVYAIPHMSFPKWLGFCQLLRFARWFGTRYAGLLAWGTVLVSVFTAFYTGMLLQSFIAVSLWHNPGVPVLFTISATSTALAALIILQYVFVQDNDLPLRHAFEKLDTILLGAEILVVIAFFYYLLNGSENAQVSFELLWGDPQWVWGFFFAGLILPFVLNLLMIKGYLEFTAKTAIVSAILVLYGGYLLRAFMLSAGVWELPYPK